MENASKALIIAAEILIGVILLMLFIGAYHAWRNVSDGITNNIELTKVQEFNSKFEVYKDKELTVYDIVTIVNMVNEFNYPDGYGKDYGNNKEDYEKIKIDGIREDEVRQKPYTFIEKNNGKKYRILEITYNENTAKRLIRKIKIEEI